MPPKVNYNLQLVEAAASDSVAKTCAEHLSDVSEYELTCVPVLAHGEQIRRSSDISFRWRFVGAGYDETDNVTAKCYHILARGVPLPPAWITAWRCLSLPRIEKASVDKIKKEEPSLTTLSCACLGAPRASIPDDKVGKLVSLCIDSGRVVCFLVDNINS